MKGPSLRWRLFTTLVLTLGIVGLSIGLFVRTHVVAAERRELDQRGVTLAHQLANQLETAMLTGHHQAAVAILAHTRLEFPEISYSLLVDAEGSVVATDIQGPLTPSFISLNHNLAQASHRILPLETELGAMRDVAVPVGTFGHILRVGMSERFIRARLLSMRPYALVFGASAMLLALAVTWLFAQTMNRALVRLANFADDVGRGDFEASLPDLPSDEFGRLAGALDQLRQRLGGYTSELEELVRRKTEALRQEERYSAIGRMSQKVAHELRNPLGSMSLNMELLDEDVKESCGEECPARSYMGRIHREIERLSALTDDYLALGRITPRDELVSIDDVIHHVADFHGPDLCRNGSHMMLDCSGGKAQVGFDHLVQVLINLIQNAVEAHPGGTVFIRSEIEGEKVIVRVADEGPGIPTHAREKIFEPFFTLKSMGSGLGLPLCQHIAAAYHGSLICESTGDHGTTFRLELPIHAAED